MARLTLKRIIVHVWLTIVCANKYAYFSIFGQSANVVTNWVKTNLIYWQNNLHLDNTSNHLEIQQTWIAFVAANINYVKLPAQILLWKSFVAWKNIFVCNFSYILALI